MKINLLISYLISLLYSLVNAKVLFFFEVFRHGARSPLKLNSSIDTLGQKWDGLSELTFSGMRMHYLLGQSLRQRYVLNSPLLNANYDPKEIYLYVTDTNRTIQSAYSHLSGLFPSRTENLTENQTNISIPPINLSDITNIRSFLGNSPLPNNFQTIPFHVMDNNNPFNLGYKCHSGINNLKKDNDNKLSSEIKALISNFSADFKENLKKSLNKTDKDFEKWEQLCDISDSFLADDFDKRNLNYLNVDLLKFNETVKQINSLDFKIYDNSSVIGKITLTPIIKQILTYMQMRINGKSGPKAVLMSAHDTNIVVTLNFLKDSLKLNNFTFTNINFASNVIIELNNNETDNTNKIRILYNDVEIYNEDINNFNTSVNGYFANETEISNFCNDPINENTRLSPTIYWIIIGTLIAIITILAILLIKISKQTKTASDDDSENLMNTR